MRIKVYQAGGNVYLPTSSKRWGQAAASPAASSSSSPESKIPGFAKEIIPLLKENGIDNDVTNFLSQVERTLRLANDPTGENINLHDIVRVQQLASRVKTNYAAYQNAEKSLDAQNAWAEPATNARGDLYVLNRETRKIEEIPWHSYSEDKHLVLTNSELLDFRRTLPEFAYDTKILDNLNGAVGMKEITDYARGIIKDFGKTEITGYSSKQNGEINSGANHILSRDLGSIGSLIGPGPDGVYTIKSSRTVVDSNIGAALEYIIRTLPNNYLNTLNAKAAAEHYDPQAMLLAMLYSDTSRSVAANYDHTASADANIGRAGVKETATKLTDHDTYLMRIATGGEWSMLPIIPNPKNPEETATYMAKASNVGELLDDKLDRIEIGNLGTVLNKLEAVKATISKDVTFGDQILKPGERNALIWDGESQLTDIWLPFKNEGGQIKPDFEKLRNFNKFNEALRNNPGISNFEKAQLMRYYNLNPEELIPLDDNYSSFQFKENVMKLFLSFGAIVNEKNLDLTDESIALLEELDSDTKKRYRDLYNNAVKYNTIARSKSTRSVNSAFRTGRRGDYYRGNIFIPIDSEWLALHSSTNQNLSPDQLTNFAQRSQMAKAIAASKDPSIANLGQWQFN